MTQKNISIEKLLDLVTTMKFKIDATNEQIINLSMLFEFIMEKLSEQNINLSTEDFEPWAEKKFKELEEIAQKAIDNGIETKIQERIDAHKKQLDLME